jgi:DNA-binding response OmpR family regulator
MISRFLGAAGYDIREAADGTAGLAMAREQRPDLVLLDMMMPGLDGWQVLRRLKGEAETASLPVIVLTASVGASLSERALRLGAARYLVKPLDTRILVETVDLLLGLQPIDEEQSDP